VTAVDERTTAVGVPSPRQVTTVIYGLMLGMLLASLDQTVVSTAMRTIADDLQGQTAQAWATTSYLIASTVSTPLYGKLSDLYGRKPLYLVAIAVFVAGSMLCGTSGSIYQLAVWRAVQGVGAGGLLSLAFTIVSDLVKPRERARYQARIMSVFATSSVLGPVLGGALAGQERLLGTEGWRWIFYVNVPLGVLAMFVIARVLRVPHTRRDHRVDAVGAGLLTAGIVPLLLVAEQGREWGWTSGLVLGLVATSVLSLVAFVPWERRMGEDAVLPLRVFGYSVFRVNTALSLLVGTVMFGGLLLVPLYLQIVRGQSATAAGLLMLPLMAGMLTTSMVIGRITSRSGRMRRYPIPGTLLIGTALLLLSRVQYDSPLWQPLTAVAVLGLGLGLTMQTLVIGVQNALPAHDMGIATSSVTFFRSVGGTLGAAVSLAILFGTVVGNIQERLVAAGVPRSVVDRFGDSASLDDTTVIATLPDAVRTAVLQGFTDSMRTAFLTVSVLMVPAFLLSLRLRETRLRELSGIEARMAEQARAEAAHV
jgi:EmrB/QacA subfamily drug resistance transporter